MAVFHGRFWFLEPSVMRCLVGHIGAGYTVFPTHEQL